MVVPLALQWLGAALCGPSAAAARSTEAHSLLQGLPWFLMAPRTTAVCAGAEGRGPFASFAETGLAGFFWRMHAYRRPTHARNR